MLQAPVGRRGWAGPIPAHLHHQPAPPSDIAGPDCILYFTGHVQLTLIPKVNNQ